MSASTQPDRHLSKAGTPHPRRKVSAETVLLLGVVVLLALSLILPWWSETEVGQGPGAVTSTQEYSPFSGVTGSCTPGCSPFFTGPPVGPIQGTHSFSSLGLNQTSILYDVGLGLIFTGLVATVLLLAVARPRPVVPPVSGRARRRMLLLILAIVTVTLSSVTLAALQPATFRSDTMATFGPHDQWTAAPSPETSFWGSCSVGPASGICASGWSVSWGPGLGWDAITAAALVLVAVQLLAWNRTRR